MHYLFTLILFLSNAHAATTKEIKEAQMSIMALLSPLVPGATHKSEAKGKFRVDQCEKHKINWTEVLLMQKEAVLNYTFKEGCDIEGTIRPKILKEFPAQLKLKNLENFTDIESTNKIQVGLYERPLLLLHMKSGLLTGKKGTVKFETDYQVQLNPMSGKVEKNPGGEIRITEIYGEKVNIKEKILIK